MNEDLRKELVALADKDQRLLQSLKEAGEGEDNACHP
jgi:hypothetical protein